MMFAIYCLVAGIIMCLLQLTGIRREQAHQTRLIDALVVYAEGPHRDRETDA